MNPLRMVRTYVLSFVLWAASLLFALKVGAVSDISLDALVLIRLPRALLASVIGAGLSVAGTALQALFTNPLCEPYTLGISSGAALGAVVGVTLGLELNVAGLTGTAFLGALAFTLVLFVISMRLDSNNTSLLLTGVMLGFLGTSLVALWIAVTESNGMQAAIGWLFGDLSRARLQGVAIAFVMVLVLSVSVWLHAREMDALLLGEEGAASLGVDVPRTRRRIVGICSLLVGSCVSAGGMIGFIGLVVPHLARRWVGSMHLVLIPIAALWGATLLTLADCGARFIARPFELPVGILTALIGAPLFLWISLKRNPA